MNSLNCHFVWVLWGLSCYLILTRCPRPPRTALRHLHYVLSGMASFAVPVVTVLLANILLWILLFKPTIPPEHWPLILATGFGIGLLPFAFQNYPFTGALSLESISRYLAGLAWASCWSLSRDALGQGNPFFLLLGAACALLPDTLDHWVSRFIHRIDIHIVPDPLDPDPALVAKSLARAIARCNDSQTPIRVEVYPGQGRNRHWHQFDIRLDNVEKRIIVSHAGTSASASIPVCLTSEHGFSMVTQKSPLSLQLSPMTDGRIQVHARPWRQGWSHSLALATGLAILIGLAFGLDAGLIAGGAFVLHILMDQLGFTGVKALFPFSARRTTGLQLLTPARAGVFHFGVTLLALLVILLNARSPGPAG